MQNQGRSGPDHQEECYTLNVFAPLQINLLKSNPKGDVLAGGAFGRDWVMRVEPSYMALVSLYKSSRELPCPFCHGRTRWEDPRLWARKWVLIRYQIDRWLGLGLPSSRTRRNELCCWWYFIRAEPKWPKTENDWPRQPAKSWQTQPILLSGWVVVMPKQWNRGDGPLGFDLIDSGA